MANILAIISGSIAACLACAGGCFKVAQMYNDHQNEIRIREPRSIEDIVIQQMKMGNKIDELDIKITVHHTKEDYNQLKKSESPTKYKVDSPLSKKD